MIHKFIESTRSWRGVSQAQLAAQAGVGLDVLKRLEAGSLTTQIGTVYKVLKVLDCEMAVKKTSVESDEFIL